MSDTLHLVRQARELAHKGLDAWQVAKQLFDPHDSLRSYYAVAKALHHEEGLRLPVDTVAKVLSSLSGLNLPFSRVANVLHHEEGLRLPVETVARALSSRLGLNLSASMVAEALHHEKGLRLSLETVARVLSSQSGLHLLAFEVAEALHGQEGLGLSLETVAKVLHHKDGLSLAPAQVALALAYTHGLALPPHKIVPVVATITPSDEALFEATVPLLRSAYDQPKDHLALMDALLHHLPTERSLPLLAKAMLAGKRPFYSPETLARLFAADDGLDVPPQSVVFALTHHDGPRLPLAQVASILTADTGLDLAPHAAAEALACGAALDPHEARRIVDNAMDSDHLPMLQRHDEGPTLARAVSTTPLVR